MSKILIAEASVEEGAALAHMLSTRGIELNVNITEDPIRDTTHLSDDITMLSVFVGSKVGVAELDACPQLRLITTRSTGTDHIDIEECERRGIAVRNVPAYGENTVAEHAFALILSLSRNIHKAWHRTKANDFSFRGLQGFDLRGKTIGLIGTGRIGIHTAKIARGFGMRVIGFDARPQELIAEVVGFEYKNLDELVQTSDIVSLHAPLTPQTHHLIDRELLAKFKRGSLLINTARGGLVDTEALLWALDEGILAGAGLDVLEGEHTLSEDGRMLMSHGTPETLRAWLGNQLLVERENVVITPHIGFDSVEAVERIMTVTADNIADFLRHHTNNPDA